MQGSFPSFQVFPPNFFEYRHDTYTLRTNYLHENSTHKVYQENEKKIRDL